MERMDRWLQVTRRLFDGGAQRQAQQLRPQAAALRLEAEAVQRDRQRQYRQL